MLDDNYKEAPGKTGKTGRFVKSIKMGSKIKDLVKF